MLTPLDQPVDPLSDLTREERATLQDWQGHFETKYIHVGYLVNSKEE
jgi:membrane-associated progesterone receptor component